MVVLGQIPEVEGQPQQVGQFGKGAEGNVNVPPEFSVPAFGRPFRDVGGDRDGGPSDLTDQAVPLVDRPRSGQSIDRQNQLMG